MFHVWTHSPCVCVLQRKRFARSQGFHIGSHFCLWLWGLEHFLEKNHWTLNSVRKLFIEFFHLYFMSLHLSISPFRINTLNPWVAKSWTRLIDWTTTTQHTYTFHNRKWEGILETKMVFFHSQIFFCLFCYHFPRELIQPKQAIAQTTIRWGFMG